jgi:hypothetical protein
MTLNTKVQFILFDTILPAEAFMKRWKEYTRSSNSDADVTRRLWLNAFGRERLRHRGV